MINADKMFSTKHFLKGWQNQKNHSEKHVWGKNREAKIHLMTILQVYSHLKRTFINQAVKLDTSPHKNVRHLPQESQVLLRNAHNIHGFQMFGFFEKTRSTRDFGRKGGDWQMYACPRKLSGQTTYKLAANRRMQCDFACRQERNMEDSQRGLYRDQSSLRHLCRRRKCKTDTPYSTAGHGETMRTREID